MSILFNSGTNWAADAISDDEVGDGLVEREAVRGLVPRASLLAIVDPAPSAHLADELRAAAVAEAAMYCCCCLTASTAVLSAAAACSALADVRSISTTVGAIIRPSRALFTPTAVPRMASLTITPAA